MGREVLFVVVDRCTKYAHFMALAHPYTASRVAQTFLDNVFKLHGMLESIVSDRDPVFFSRFWQDLFRLQGVELLASSTYHPQTDGQSEAVNKCLETYLRCMTGDKPALWAKWISLAEWWYNTTYHTSAGRTPFEALYGFLPPLHMPYFPQDSLVAAIDSYMIDREDMIRAPKHHLKGAQDRMKVQADKKRSEREFSVGDKVYLKLQPYRQATVNSRPLEKLSPKFFGPYDIVDKIGKFNTSPAEATWEYADELRWRFPGFDLGGKGFEGEGNVTRLEVRAHEALEARSADGGEAIVAAAAAALGENPPPQPPGEPLRWGQRGRRRGTDCMRVLLEGDGHEKGGIRVREEKEDGQSLVKLDRFVQL
ncbi:hypothetical protein CRG98_044835 [Punica granatum]|uniref:Integrase catalytic domain-containing protein n=1 Tax=Punica granatum TaxID=22663 RepID=A0A2I0HST9_PUNGR|nr:hypothetical protein CRG98_044835 [Punica granatum]